jgi:intracellular septation protein A
MKFSKWIRQSHRWLSIWFTLTVLANFVIRVRHEPSAWVTYPPLPPLFLLLFSGLYLFATPYLRRVDQALSADEDKLVSR